MHRLKKITPFSLSTTNHTIEKKKKKLGNNQKKTNSVSHTQPKNAIQTQIKNSANPAHSCHDLTMMSTPLGSTPYFPSSLHRPAAAKPQR
jgi:hypothetical protein